MTAVFWPSSSVLQTTLGKKKVFLNNSLIHTSQNYRAGWCNCYFFFLVITVLKKLSCHKQEVSTGWCFEGSVLHSGENEAEAGLPFACYSWLLCCIEFLSCDESCVVDAKEGEGWLAVLQVAPLRRASSPVLQPFSEGNAFLALASQTFWKRPVGVN